MIPSPGIEPKLLASQATMLPLYYIVYFEIYLNHFEANGKTRVWQEGPPLDLKCSKYTSDPVGLIIRKIVT